MRKLTVLLAAAALAATATPALAGDPLGLGLPGSDLHDQIGPPVRATRQTFPGAGELVFAPENNHLNAYSVETGDRYRVITSATDDPAAGRDINGQVCFDPLQPGKFVAGEDTGQNGNGVAGWGYFRLTSDATDGLAAVQIGKLAPAYLGEPDNHGCGFLSDGSLVTATIGDRYPGQAANGELIIWFRGPSGGYRHGYTTAGRDGTATNTPYGTVPYCKLAVDLPTAGGVWVDGDTILVATNRPQGGDDGNPVGGEPGGVRRYRFTGAIPQRTSTGVSGCHKVTVTDQATGSQVTEWWADDGLMEVEQLFTDGQAGFVNGMAVTPSGVVGTGRGTFYVSSVFTGTVVEVDAEGRLVRPILVPGEGAVVDGGVTPFGMTVDSQGDLWIADLGIVGVEAAPLAGSVVRIPILDDGTPLAPVAVDRLLTFPDGLGTAMVDL